MYLIECKDEKVEVSTSKIMEGESIWYDTVVWYYYIICVWRKSFCDLQMNYVKSECDPCRNYGGVINFILLLVEVGGQ